MSIVHVRYQCVHGITTRQCRCPSRDKVIRIDDCPRTCPPGDVDTKPKDN